MSRVLDGKTKALLKLFKSLTLRDEFRDILSCYDLELLYDDPDRDEPREYVFLERGEDQPDTYGIRFRPFGWEAKREAVKRPGEYKPKEKQ